MSNKSINLTLQGLNNPVTAAFGGARAGHRSSSSNDCNVTPVSLARVTQNATSLNNSVERSPFERSSVIKRTPPSGKTINLEVTAVDAATSKTQPNFAKLGDKIMQLSEFLKGRSNIHKEIVSMTKEIQALYMLAKEDRSEKTADVSNTRMEDKETQTEGREPPRSIATPVRKRPAKMMSPNENISNKKDKRDLPNIDSAPEVSRKSPNEESETVPGKTSDANGNWKEVKKKRIRKRSEHRAL